MAKEVDDVVARDQQPYEERMVQQIHDHDVGKRTE
jgi:hypothetical protein